MAPSVGVEWWRSPAMVGPAQARPEAAPAKDSAVPFAASLIFTSVLLLAPETSIPGLGRVRLAFLMGVFAIVAYCWTRLAAGRPLMRVTREVWLVGALLGWAVITLPFSKEMSESTRVLLDVFVKSLGAFWLVSNTVTTLGRLRMTAWVLGITSLPLAAIAAWEFVSHRVIPLGESQSGRIAGYSVAGTRAGLTGDANTLAMMLNLILPLTVALFFVTRRPWARGLLAVLIALDASAIVFTFSRGGFVTLGITFILYLRTLHKWRERQWVIAAVVLAMAAIPLMPRAYLDRLDTLTTINADSSAAQRWQSIRFGLPFVLSHPLPIGLGMNAIVLAEAEESERQSIPIRIGGVKECFCLGVHNTYLDYGIELGWFGLGLFILLLASCIRSATRVRDRCAGLPRLRELSVLAEGIRLTLVAFAVSAFFFPWPYYLYFYYFAGLAVSAWVVYEAEARTAAEVPSG